ncbi:hypothetical protein [Saccharothrix syringae]|uniref:DUF11 domain-containing protein n=1 Tax=Saccharothrix syringae TaxID=103733 RepID=A0A5Q0HCX4_SACSY|nr:hypothetical protein [Saccharothrix syringae]QFZ23805.1 hypothetical protein EKG83_45850 [Saccharothrix syringae]
MGKLIRAAAVAAVVAVLAPGGVAGARESGTITIEGLVYFDRNTNGLPDPGERPLANARGVRVFNGATKEFIGEYGTDADGRYRVELPDTPLAIYNHNTDLYQATSQSSFHTKGGGGTFDFGIRGAWLPVNCWLDDGDGAFNGEPAPPGGCPLRITGGPGVDRPVDAPTEHGDLFFQDVPAGEYEVTAAPLFKDGLALVGGTNPNLVDWTTYAKKISVVPGEAEPWVEAGYAPATGDIAVGVRVEPARERYEIGDEIEIVVPVTNRGTAPERATFVIGEPHDKVERLSISDNATTDAPGSNVYLLKDRLLPGATTEVRVKVRIKARFTDVNVSARAVNELRDADFSNNVVGVRVRVGDDEPSTTPTTGSTTSSAPSSSSSVPPTTTTTTAAAAASAGSGLAGTGAAPLGLAALGLVLLGGGAFTLLVARRRRRA